MLRFAAEAISVKATPMAQADLLERDPETFGKAAYVGRFGWVTVDLRRVERGELERLLRDAWRSVAPRALLRQTGIAD